MQSNSIPRWLVTVSFVLGVVAMGLHLKEVFATGLAQPPIYAAYEGSDAYPSVGGSTVEVRGVHELEPGDQLIRLREIDLTGRGYLGVLGLLYQEADANQRVPLIYERNGVRQETALQLQSFAIPWLRVPFLLSMLIIGMMIMSQQPNDPNIRFGALTFSAICVGESIFDGGSYAQAITGKLVFILGGLVWFPLIVRYAAGFPDGVTSPRFATINRVAKYVSALVWTLPKLLYIESGPIPSTWVPAIVYSGDVISVCVIAMCFANNYRTAAVDMKRRMKWVVYAAWAAGIPMVSALLLPILAPGFSYIGEALAVAGILAAIIPIGSVVAILGYDLLDIDRLISATASYSLMLAALLASLVAGVPWLANGLASPLGIEVESTRLVLSVLFAGLSVPIYQWLRPRIDGWFFPERRRLEDGMEELLSEQILETHAEPLAVQAARRMLDLFHAEFVTVFTRQEDGYTAWLSLPEGRAPKAASVGRDHPLALALAKRSSPLAIGERHLTTSQDQRVDLGSVFQDAAHSSLLVPIREFDTLPAFVALGPKRSGDSYPATEIALISATAEAAKRQLERVREAEALAQERIRSVELDRKRREAETAQLTRSRHLAAASHDLRQPLHALRLFAEALMGEAKTPKVSDLAERIRGSAEALHEMFDALIDLSRLEQGMLVPDVSVFSLAPMLDRLRAEAELMSEAKGLALTVDVPEVDVESDPIVLTRILQNLLTNALRYTHEGHVAIRAQLDGENVTLRIEDSGPGIPESKQEAIFEEFVRLDADNSQRGLGLGLAIVKRLSDLLGHRLSLESELGHGTTFSLTLPVAKNSHAAVPSRSDAPLDGHHLLLLDDDLDVLVGMRSLLESWGARVSLATDGAEALEALETGGTPDAVIADFRLRDGETGVQVIQQLRAETTAALPALVITGSTSGEVGDEIRGEGLLKLQKPVSPARLRAALSQLLRDA